MHGVADAWIRFHLFAFFASTRGFWLLRRHRLRQRSWALALTADALVSAPASRSLPATVTHFSETISFQSKGGKENRSDKRGD